MAVFRQRAPATAQMLTMRLSLRFLFPLLLALGSFAWAAVPLVDAWMTRWYLRDLETRSTFVAQTIREPLSDLLQSTSTARIPRGASWWP